MPGSEESPSLLSSQSSYFSSNSIPEAAFYIKTTAFSSTACSHRTATTTLCPTLPHSIEFKSLDNVTVGSTATIPSQIVNMSGGMEDAHSDDREQRIQAEQRGSPPSADNEEGSVVSEPKGQELIDFQMHDDDSPVLENALERESEDEEADEESVPASQPPAAAPTASSHHNPPTNNTASPPQAANPNNGFDLSSLFNHISRAIATSVGELKNDLEKKERANEVKRAADMAELYSLRDQLKEARLREATKPPPANIHIPDVATTPSSKTTFASVTSATTPSNGSTHQSPSIPLLQNTPPRSSNSVRPANPYARPSPNFMPSGTNPAATIIRSTPSSVKYRALTPIEYEGELTKYHGLFPTSKTVYAEAPPYEHNLLWIKAVASLKTLSKFRSDDDDSDFDFAAVGHHFIDSISLFEKYYTVELVKAYEVKITSNAKDERCIGMIAIRLISSQGMTTMKQINKLKHLAQTAIFTEAYADLQPVDLPTYVQAFRFDINPVNYPQFIIFGLLQGVEVQWFDKSDHIGLGWLMDGVYSNFKSKLPKALENWIDRVERLGLVIYSSSSAPTNGQKYGQTIAVAYAPTIPGHHAAAEFVKAFQGMFLTLCGGLSVTIECFPPKTKARGKQQDSIASFAKNAIVTNHRMCNDNYKLVLLDGLTNAIAEPKTQINMLVLYKHLAGIVPRTIKIKRTAGSAHNFGFGAGIILHRSSQIVGREASFFRKIFKPSLPELFPHDLEDDANPDDDFTLVENRKKHNKAAPNSTSVKDTISKLENHIKSTVDPNARYYVVFGGRGGRRSINVYTAYNDGIRGARYVSQGVSGAHIRGFDNIDDAYAELELRYPGLNSPAAIRSFHEGIPHRETNMSPTWNEFDGKTFHKYGAVAFEYTEVDDEELLLKRIEATKRLTGSVDGVINKREHYFATRWTPSALNGNSSAPKDPAGSSDTQQGNNYAKSGPEDSATEDKEQDEDFPYSQDYLPNEDDEESDHHGSSNASTRSRSSSPAKKRKVEEDDTQPATSNPTSNDSKYDCYPIAISLPSSAARYDALLYLNAFSPGLGNHWPGQARLGTFKPFPLCQVLILQCPKNLSRGLREYVHTHKMWDKWQLFSGRVTSESQVTYEITMASSPKELLAKDPLMQCVKHTIHPKHEVELLLLLDNNPHADGQFVFNYYLANWKDDALGDHSKNLSDDWRVPRTNIGFDPAQWTPPPRDGFIDPESFDGATARF
jgi:hypothetical protein